jgi:hypothetical protein
VVVGTIFVELESMLGEGDDVSWGMGMAKTTLLITVAMGRRLLVKYIFAVGSFKCESSLVLRGEVKCCAFERRLWLYQVLLLLLFNFLL